MNCEECEGVFAAYIDKLLPQESAHEVESHVAECSACRSRLDETRRLFHRLVKDSQGASLISFDALVMDRIVQEQARRLRRNASPRIVRVAIAAGLLLCACAGAWYLVAALGAGRAYADVVAAVKQIESANTATWTTKFYQRRNSNDSDGQARLNDTIEGQVRQMAYKAPGLYRKVTLDENGQITSIDINDTINLKRLFLRPKEKEATLFYLSKPTYRPNGPFTVEREYLRSKNLEWLGKRSVPGSEAANGFRYSFWFERANQNWSYDFWIDAQTKQLVAYRVPGIDILDPNQVYEETAKGMHGSGSLQHSIVFGTDLDDSLFSFDVPNGYTLTVERPVEITEKEIIEFLGVVAEYFDNTFPSRMPRFDYGSEHDRLQRVMQSPKEKRTLVENRLVEAIDKYHRMFLPGPGPMPQFIQTKIVDGSWRYVGRGVKLGDSTRIVCWYRPKDSVMYRVVYGDLSVKSVAPNMLPLPTGK